MTLESPLTVLKGVGESQAAKFALFGVRTVGDLLEQYPRRYDDYSHPSTIDEMQPGIVTIRGKITNVSGRYVRRGMHITEAEAYDASGSVRLTWFNQSYRAAAIKPEQDYFITGPFELKRQRFSIANPSLDLAGDLASDVPQIMPVYRETKGLVSKQVHAAIMQCEKLCAGLAETLPAATVKKHKLMSRGQAIWTIHNPADADELEEARRRLGFEEVFQLTLAALLNKQENQSETALSIAFDEQLARTFVSQLPFALTGDQKRVIWQIYLDLQKTQPMNRLVEGDVGSGKTVVATMAALMVLAQSMQVALMAPTELLARQHADTIHTLLKGLHHDTGVVLLVGSMKKAQKEQARAAIASGKAKFIIGTHALIQESVDMHQLALIVIDEQHRFGVEQRKKLMVKAGHMPHVLSLTATPIPRSLALTLYGELDISVLAEKPVGRLAIETELVSPNSRAQLNEKIEQELTAGRQMFVVCPLIQESAAIEASSSEAVYERMRTKEFKHRRIGLLHGKLAAPDKQDVMQQFVDHKLDILVATTVIEVGVDVPNATIMLIESAERFGLAQLHQLRGRVGRGKDQAYCYLALSDSKAPSKRLRALESSNDGFKLAELDLELRGPGAIYGSSQHGLLDLRIAKLSDTALIASARQSAQALLDSGEDLLHYTELMKHVNRLRAVTNLN